VTPKDVYLGRNSGVIDMLGEAECDEVRPTERQYVPLPIIHKDFVLHWRDLEEATAAGTPVDAGAVASAAAYCARSEDELIFIGNDELGYPGLLNVPGHQSVPMSDWAQLGNAFSDVVAAVEKLTSHGYPGPFALAVSTRLFVAMNRMFENSGLLEIDQIKKLMTAGVYMTSVLPEPSAVVVSSGPENLDLVVGVDMTAAYLETSKMNHHFRVLETLALRIKRPESVCVIEEGASA
jgi:uncharacterized linocin/CFP29 family protein